MLTQSWQMALRQSIARCFKLQFLRRNIRPFAAGKNQGASKMSGQSTWDEKYKHDRFAYGVEPNVFIKEAALKYLTSEAGSKQIVELASGEGRNVVFLAKMGHHVHAVDFSSAGVEKTRRLAQEQGCPPDQITCHHADVLTWQPPNGPGSIDAVIMSFCHMFQDKKPQLFSNVTSMLKPGGLLLLETFRPEQISGGYREKGSGGPPDPTMMYSLDELRSFLPAGQELEGYNTEYHLKEGPLHDGPGAVVRYVWKKN